MIYVNSRIAVTKKNDRPSIQKVRSPFTPSVYLNHQTASIAPSNAAC
ncbi:MULTISPECIES: hypothetical protein [unclassified Microcoleus]